MIDPEPEKVTTRTERANSRLYNKKLKKYAVNNFVV